MRRLAVAATLFVALVVPLLATTIVHVISPGEAAERAPMTPIEVAAVSAIAGVIMVSGVVVARRAQRLDRELRRQAR